MEGDYIKTIFTEELHRHVANDLLFAPRVKWLLSRGGVWAGGAVEEGRREGAAQQGATS